MKGVLVVDNRCFNLRFVVQIWIGNVLDKKKKSQHAILIDILDDSECVCLYSSCDQDETQSVFDSLMERFEKKVKYIDMQKVIWNAEDVHTAY